MADEKQWADDYLGYCDSEMSQAALIDKYDLRVRVGDSILAEMFRRFATSREPKSLWGWPIEEIKSAMRQWQATHGSKLPTEVEKECQNTSPRTP